MYSKGEATISTHLDSNAGPAPKNRAEPVFYEYSRLTIATVSKDELMGEPASLSLLSIGAGILLLRKRLHDRGDRKRYGSEQGSASLRGEKNKFADCGRSRPCNTRREANTSAYRPVHGAGTPIPMRHPHSRSSQTAERFSTHKGRTL